MTFRDAAKWNTRVSLLYAAGVWTMFGSLAYLKYTGAIEKDSEMEERQKEKDEAPNPNRVVYVSGSMTSTTIYKENHIPYTTRIYNFVKPFFETEDKPK